MNLQEAFNVVWEHAKKKVKGMNSDCVCAYRGESGPCFVGLLIPDAKYSKEIELKSAALLMVFSPSVFDIDVDNGYEVIRFISQLQQIHDNYDVEDWRTRLVELANCHKLIVPKD